MDYNGTLDVVLTTSSNKLCIVPGGKLVWASTEAVVCEPIVPVDQQADLVGQWTAISVNGQMRPDLFGAVADGAALITFNSTTGMYERKASPFQGACELAAEHSHAFIDINGDCFADMVLTCKPQFKDVAWTSSFEIWLASKPTAAAAPVFTKQLTVDVPSRIGPVSFVDIDADGDSDLVYVLCSDQTETTTCDVGNAIHAHLNNQDPLTDSSVLCPVDPTFSLSTAWFVVYDLSVASANSRFLIHTTHLAPGSTATVPIRWGDYNIDGFPDALVTLVDVEKGTTSVQLLANVACSSGCSAGAKRSLAVDAAATGAISNLENGLSAFFFDFDERGRLSVIAMQTAGELIVPFFNNIHADAFFMKTLILNGVCYGTSTCGIAVNPVGVNEPGVTVKFVVTDTQGVRRLVQGEKNECLLLYIFILFYIIFAGSQLPQFCYGSLNAPYVFYGLGRTNSYIDDFSVGLLVQSVLHELLSCFFFLFIKKKKQIGFSCARLERHHPQLAARHQPVCERHRLADGALHPPVGLLGLGGPHALCHRRPPIYRRRRPALDRDAAGRP